MKTEWVAERVGVGYILQVVKSLMTPTTSLRRKQPRVVMATCVNSKETKSLMYLEDIDRFNLRRPILNAFYRIAFLQMYILYPYCLYTRVIFIIIHYSYIRKRDS